MTSIQSFNHPPILNQQKLNQQELASNINSPVPQTSLLSEEVQSHSILKQPMRAATNKIQSLLKNDKVKWGLGALGGIAGVAILLAASALLIKLCAGAIIAASLFSLYSAYKIGQDSVDKTPNNA